MTWANWLLILMIWVYQSLSFGISEEYSTHVFFIP